MIITTDMIAYVVRRTDCDDKTAIDYIEACEGDFFEAAELIKMDRYIVG